MLAAIAELRRTHYDVALDLQGLLKSAVLARMSGATRVIGFSIVVPARAAGARVLHRRPRAGRGSPHVVFQNLSLLERARPDGRDAGVSDRAHRVGGRERHARADGGRYALINPGAAWPNKRWPPARFGAVAGRAARAARLASVVLWGPGEEAIAGEVVASSGGAAMLSPPTTIADLVALARGAALMISGDTGPTHIAAAVGTPIVGLFGPTRPARNGPWAADGRHRVARRDLRVSSSAPLPPRDDVPDGRRGRRSARRRAIAGWPPRPRGRAWLIAVIAAQRCGAGSRGCGSRWDSCSARSCCGSRRRRRRRWLRARPIAVAGEALRVWAAGHLEQIARGHLVGSVSLVRASAVRRIVDHRRRPRDCLREPRRCSC